MMGRHPQYSSSTVLFELARKRNAGAEACTCTAHRAMAKATTPVGPIAILLLDGENAFGKLDQQTVFDIIAAKCPLLEYVSRVPLPVRAAVLRRPE